MDRFWKDAADFLAEQGLKSDRIAGPGELRKLVPGLVPYARLMCAPLDKFDSVVIHKGMLARLGRRLVDSIRSSLNPVFANEVFVVFARAPAGGAVDRQHVDSLGAMLRGIPDEPPAYTFTDDVADAVSELLSLTTGGGQPNVNPLWSALRNLTVLHTTEYSYLGRARVDDWPTVYFERDDFLSVAQRLTAAGHEVAPLDFAPGSAPMDVFVDVPPFSSDLDYPREQMLPLPDSGDDRRWGAEQHLKFSIDGVPSTCFGLIVRKARPG